MRMTRFATCLAIPLLAPPAMAEPRMQDVISAVTMSFANDGETDRAILVQDGFSADLFVFRGVPEVKADAPAAKPSFIKPGLVYADTGDIPSLRVNDKGSLVIASSHEGSGRTKTEQHLIVAYRNGDYVVAGFDYSMHDSLDPNQGGSCEINFLSGKAVRNGKAATERVAPMKLVDWSDDKLPRPCQF